MADDGTQEAAMPQPSQAPQKDVVAQSQQEESGGSTATQDGGTDELNKAAKEKDDNGGDEKEEQGGEANDMEAMEEAVDKGLRVDGDSREALKAIAAGLVPAFSFRALIEVQEELNRLFEEERISRRAFEGARDLLRKEAREMRARPLEEQIDALLELEDNPFARSLGYDLKISRLKQELEGLKGDNKEVEEKRKKIESEIDKLSEERKKLELKDDKGNLIEEHQAANELYEFLTGEPRSEDSPATFSDIESSISALVNDGEKAQEFIRRVREGFSEEEWKTFEPLLKQLENFNPEEGAVGLVKAVGREKAFKKVKTAGGLLALVAIFLVWRAKKSEGGGQR